MVRSLTKFHLDFFSLAHFSVVEGETEILDLMMVTTAEVQTMLAVTLVVELLTLIMFS